MKKIVNNQFVTGLNSSAKIERNTEDYMNLPDEPVKTPSFFDLTRYREKARQSENKTVRGETEIMRGRM